MISEGLSYAEAAEAGAERLDVGPEDVVELPELEQQPVGESQAERDSDAGHGDGRGDDGRSQGRGAGSVRVGSQGLSREIGEPTSLASESQGAADATAAPLSYAEAAEAGAEKLDVGPDDVVELDELETPEDLAESPDLVEHPVPERLAALSPLPQHGSPQEPAEMPKSYAEAAQDGAKKLDVHSDDVVELDELIDEKKAEPSSTASGFFAHLSSYPLTSSMLSHIPGPVIGLGACIRRLLAPVASAVNALTNGYLRSALHIADSFFELWILQNGIDKFAAQYHEHKLGAWVLVFVWQWYVNMAWSMLPRAIKGTVSSQLSSARESLQKVKGHYVKPACDGVSSMYRSNLRQSDSVPHAVVATGIALGHNGLQRLRPRSE